jgi:Abortive infection C-terminus
MKATLVSRATGGSADDVEYQRLRAWLMADKELSNAVPSWLRSHRNLSEFWTLAKEKFQHYEERRRWLRAEFEPLLARLESDQTFPSDASTTSELAKHGTAYIREAWSKALSRREQDPEGAITSARTLLEEVCRHILDDTVATYDTKDDLPKLYGLASKQLKLAPSLHTEEVFKQILGGCHSVVQGLGSLRNRASDAHAKGRSGVKPGTRHAGLAVNLAGAMATFLLATYEAREEPSP